MKYKFRGLPCSIRPDNLLWYVSGSFEKGGGILEWCYDEDDAKYRMSLMEKDVRFSDLSVHKFID